jgi:ribonuclease P protein component
MAVRSISNEQELTRYAFAISKRVGKAVTRNRVRRRLREILRSLAVHEGFDIVLTLRPEASMATFAELRIELELLLRRAKLLDTRESPQGGSLS